MRLAAHQQRRGMIDRAGSPVRRRPVRRVMSYPRCPRMSRLSGGLVTVSNSLTKRILLSEFRPSPAERGNGVQNSTHPPLFPAANRLPTCDQTRSPHALLKALRQPHENPQSRLSGRRPRHPRPARHQGDAEGNADHRRQAADPVCGRRGQGSRHRTFHLRHRPQQGRDRGSFRPHVRTRRHARRRAARRPRWKSWRATSRKPAP